MTSPEQVLKALTRPGADPVTVRMMVVAAVRDDGLVNLTFGNQTVTGVPALASYTPRAAGDVVSVAQNAAGWLVLGNAGPEAAAAEVSWSEVTEKPQIVTLDFGESPPAGTGWTKGAIWVKDGKIWVDTSTAGGGGGGSSPGRVPPTAPVSAITDGAYRSGVLTDEPNPIQGAWSTSSYPAYSGAWFYSDHIKNACDTGTVDFIEMRLTRSAAYHGVPRGVPTRLFLHAEQGITTHPPALFSATTGPFLALGEAATWQLPPGWVTQLASGAARGIGCAAPKGGDYLIYGACGDLTVHFK
jgi:hypothetical protein